MRLLRKKRRFILTSGFISSVRFIISLYARRLRGRPSLTHEMQQCLPPLSLSSLHAHIFISPIFEWLNYSDLCKWVVFIFPRWKWKLKVTQRDPHLLLKLNCSECAVWIIVTMEGFVNRRAVTLQTCSICTSLEESQCYDLHSCFYKALFKYSWQNKSNHVLSTVAGQRLTLSRPPV